MKLLTFDFINRWVVSAIELVAGGRNVITNKIIGRSCTLFFERYFLYIFFFKRETNMCVTC